MSNVILKNRTKRPPRMLVLSLTRDVAAVTVTNRTTQETKTGERRKRISTKLVPDSIRIPSGGRSAPIPAEYLNCPDVAAAIRSRDLEVIAVEEAPEKSEDLDDSKGKTNDGPKPRRRRG